MRAYTADFRDKNVQLRKETRWTVAVHFDTAVHYLTSHNDCEVPPGTDAANVTYGVLENPIISSQTLDIRKAGSSVGSMSIQVNDEDNFFTTLLNTRLQTNDEGIRHKKIVAYRGYRGLTWANYQVPPGGTQIVSGDLSCHRGTYTINCRDIQRYTKKDIFEQKSTNLTADYTAGDSTITVNDTTGFELVAHGPSFTDAPGIQASDISVAAGDNSFNSTTTNFTNYFVAGQQISSYGFTNSANNDTSTVVSVTATKVVVSGVTLVTESAGNVVNLDNLALYFRIKDTAFRAKGKTGTTFTQCVGGVFGTKDVDIEIDDTIGISADRQPEVTEVPYLEMPAPKMALAIYSNTLYNQNGATIPDHWGLSIDSSWLATSSFTTIGVDLWDPEDDTMGSRILRFVGLKKREAKKFIQEQLLRPCGCFPIVHSDGQLGIKLSTRMVSNTPYIAKLDSKNVISYSELKHSLDDTANKYRILWNHDLLKGRSTRGYGTVYVDTASTARHQDSNIIDLEFEGLHGSRHTDEVIFSVFDSLRDRYSGPPEKITVDCFQIMNGLEIGDVVWCDFNQRDFVGGGNLSRAFEVQGYHDTGTRIVLTLFGSSQAPGALSSTSAATVMSDDFYDTTVGLLAGNKLDSVLTTSLTGGVLHITASGTLTGGDDMNDVDNIYWYDGPVQIDNGVDVDWTDNIQLRIRGDYDVVGSFTAGLGHAGASTTDTAGTIGYAGMTQGGSGFNHESDSNALARIHSLNRRDAPSAKGLYDGARPLVLKNNSTSLEGIHPDMRTTSGGSGAGVVKGGTVEANGGAGGDGRGACVVICRGMSIAASGSVVLDGGQSSVGSTKAIEGKTVRAGAGSPGSPGVFYCLLDGATAAVPDLSKFSALMPDPVFLGHPTQADSTGIAYLVVGDKTTSPDGTNFYNRNTGTHGQDLAESMVQVQYIPAVETAVEDIPDETTVASAINVAPVASSAAGVNFTSLEIDVTPPTGVGNYRGSRIWIAANGTEGWQDLGEVRSTDEIVFTPAFPGITYKIRAFPVSKKGIQSEDYIETTYAVGGAIEAVFGTGNQLVSNTAPDINGGTLTDGDGVAGFDSSGNQTFELNAATGRFTSGDTLTERYIDFDPSTGELILGRDVQLVGTNSYNNQSYYYETYFDSIDAWYTATTGDGTIGVDHNGLSIYGSTASTTVDAYKGLNTSYIFSWSKDRKFQIDASINWGGSLTGTVWYFVTGQLGGSGNYFGFKLDGSNALKGVSASGGTETVLDLSTSLSASTMYTFEAEFLSGTSVEFFVNGSSVGTITTNLPSGTVYAGYLVDISLALPASSPPTFLMNCFRTRLVQMQ